MYQESFRTRLETIAVFKSEARFKKKKKKKKKKHVDFNYDCKFEASLFLVTKCVIIKGQISKIV